MHSFIIQQHCGVRYKVVSYFNELSTALRHKGCFFECLSTSSVDPQPVNGPKLNFDGIPFMIIGTPVCDCLQGKDRNVALKMRI